MPFITPVEPEDAPPEVKRIYESSIKQRGMVFNNWKSIANSPKVLRGYTQFTGAMLNPEDLEKRTLELAIIKTSIINQCYY